MSTVQELEEAVRRLSPEDKETFRAWYAEYDADDWDRQFEADVASGNLNWLAEEARNERQTGRCTDR